MILKSFRTFHEEMLLPDNKKQHKHTTNTIHTHTIDDDKLKTADKKACIIYTRAKSIKVGLKETDESNA